MQFLLYAIVLLRSSARATASIRARFFLFDFLLIWLFVDYVFLQIYFNRKGRKGLRKGRKVFKKICESAAKKDYDL
jgi:hypothetical protein